MTEPTSYANAWLALLPQVHLPGMAAQALARELARYADWKTGANARPSRERLAWNLNTSPDTIKDNMATLRAYGVLVEVSRGGLKGSRGSTASVHALSVPEHLATPANLATFPHGTPRVVAAKVIGTPKRPQDDPARRANDAPEGDISPSGNATVCLTSGGNAPRPVGEMLPAQWGTYSPPPSIDPPHDP